MKSLHLSRPYAIMTVGIPGSGKTFFAHQFATTLNTPYIDFDEINERAADPDKTGELALMFLTELAKTNQTFIFEGNSASRTHRSEFARLARSLGYTPLFIWVQTDQSTALRRIAKDRHYTKAEFLESLREFSPPHPDEKPLVISGKHTFMSQAKMVLKYFSGENRTNAKTSIQAPERNTPSPAPASERQAANRHNISVR